ncbi:hypothetical protein CN692_13195 [Bacillus sp. AFS002410]|uniref:HD-GYP domain-containing protein n=1 Tax=Bacillus sp. AFS002410 TaxID=2033481 RepID=UPI000BF15092|nr:HD-GYP domain-containing protein [Bacillus sp. AFS002410]PEJ57364.1 hypothetical protein CN692_13195 [Bacillus sp. AFS002410]
MRVVETSTLVPGMILRKPIYNEHGNKVVSANIPLTEKMIKRLHELNVLYAFVHALKSESIKTETAISDEMHVENIKKINDTFVKFKNEAHYLNWLSLEKVAPKLKGRIESFLNELILNKDVLALLSSVLLYDENIFAHSLNVTLYSLAIGIKLELNTSELDLLGLGALLHDVGKIAVPKKVLNKPDRLTEEEYELIKQHTFAGYELLRDTINLHPIVAQCAIQHHERINGSGYPKGISGKDIHLFSKIIAVADFYDAVTSNRVYRQAMLPSEGLNLLNSGIDKLFDAKLVGIFKDLLTIYPTGLNVKLSDGRSGIVTRQNEAVTDRPIIRISEENSKKLSIPYEVNLMYELSLIIIECDQTLKQRVYQ